jgi:hypothetical protein
MSQDTITFHNQGANASSFPEMDVRSVVITSTSLLLNMRHTIPQDIQELLLLALVSFISSIET